jgi:spore germination protein GerM
MNNSRSGSKVVLSPFTRAVASCLTVALAATCLNSCAFFPIGKDIGGPHALKTVTAEPYVPRGKELKIFFVKQDNGTLDIVPLSKPKYSNDALTSAVEELLQGPDKSETAEGFGTEIPGGTILLGIKRSGNNVEINLSKRFAAGGGPTSLETRLEQLSRTVKDVEGNVDVYVNIEGERLTATNADGLEIAQPINRQPEFN